MAPYEKRHINAGERAPRQPQEGLAAMPGWARLESAGLLPVRVGKKRLSGMRRKGEREPRGTVCGDTKGSMEVSFLKSKYTL